jgi:hypothetical protein
MSKRDLSGQKAAAHSEKVRRITRPAGATTKEAAEQKAGAKLGAKVERTRRAAYAIEQAEDVANAIGQPVDEAATWSDQWGDEFTIAEAREIVAEAESFARPGGNAKYRRTNPAVMAERDIWAIATAAARATASAIGARVNRKARVTDDEFEDLRSDLMAEILRHGHGRPATVRWDAIGSDDEAAEAAATRAGIDPGSWRRRWEAHLILHGRGWRRIRAERMAAETDLEAAERRAAIVAEGRRVTGDDASDEAAFKAGEAARLARIAATETATATATVGDVAARLEAAGRPLGKAERLTLEAALLGRSRRELAERYGMAAESVKKSLGRGREGLAERWPTPAAARRAMAAGSEAAMAAERRGYPSSDPRSTAGDVCRWLREADAIAAAVIADGWLALTRHESVKPPRPPQRPRRYIGATMRATFPTTRHGRPAEVLAWIDRASRCQPRPRHVGYRPAPITVLVTPAAAPRGGTAIVTAWGPQKAANARRPNAAPVVTGTAREARGGRTTAERATWSETPCDCPECKPRRATKRATASKTGRP